MTARRLQAVCLALVISVLTVFAIAGQSRLSGPVLWGSKDWGHGVHRDDLLVAGCWLIGMVLCALMARGPRASGDPVPERGDR